VLVGDADGPEAVVAAAGDRSVVVHDAKALGHVPDNLEHDTMIAAYLLDPAARAYPLDELAADRGFGAEVDDPTARDALLTGALAAWQRKQLTERGHDALLKEIELPLVRALREMELAGCRLDTERLAEISTRVKADAAALEREIFELAGEEFTIGSPQQVGHILFEKLELTRKRRGKTGFSTDARVLAQIRDEHPIIEKIESWRELTKLKNTYLDSLPELIDPATGRVHTTFNQASTTTGRLSSTNPNLQNIPIRTEIGRPVRACFVAEEDARLLSADYSQVELRVLAHVADEEVLKAVFRAGEDVHAATAAEVFEIGRDEVDVGQRSKAKMVNFGIVYGLTGFGLADRLNIPRKEGEEFVARYLERFPAVRAFREQVVERAQEEGFVTTLMGRRRSIPELRSGNPNTRRLGERLAVNTVIQGTAADIIKVAMVRCELALRETGGRTRLVLQIHDELLFEGPPDEMERATELVRREMTAAYQLDPSLEVDIGVGRDWLDAK
jgi:DNA polymerase-1